MMLNFSGLKFKSDAYRSALGIPIRSSRTVIGSIVLINKKEDDRFNEKDLDYLLKFGQIITPFFNNIQQLQIFFEHPIPESVLLKKYANLGLIGRSEKFIALLQAIEAAGRCDVRVMLQGPSGTGKELVARAIHKMTNAVTRHLWPSIAAPFHPLCLKARYSPCQGRALPALRWFARG
jgi:transcriptional regulator with GAF, ATPase, and Fis domain